MRMIVAIQNAENARRVLSPTSQQAIVAMLGSLGEGNCTPPAVHATRFDTATMARFGYGRNGSGLSRMAEEAKKALIDIGHESTE
eukprot:scaffold2045_cov404-Prasinococcus_capsulatus_cf.AAC.42